MHDDDQYNVTNDIRAVIPNRGYELAFLRHSLTTENSTKIKQTDVVFSVNSSRQFPYIITKIPDISYV